VDEFDSGSGFTQYSAATRANCDVKAFTRHWRWERQSPPDCGNARSSACRRALDMRQAFDARRQRQHARPATVRHQKSDLILLKLFLIFPPRFRAASNGNLFSVPEIHFLLRGLSAVSWKRSFGRLYAVERPKPLRPKKRSNVRIRGQRETYSRASSGNINLACKKLPFSLAATRRFSSSLPIVRPCQSSSGGKGFQI